MFILKIILGIVLVLLILLLLLLFLLLVCKTCVHIVREQNKDMNIWIKFGALRIKTYPFGKSKGKINTQTHNETPRFDNDFSPKELDLSWCFELALDIIDSLKDKLYIDKLYFTLIIASDNAAKTGIILGTAFSVSGMIIPILKQNFNIKDESIILDADFDDNKTKFSLDLIAHTRIIQVLFVAFKYRKQLFKLYQNIK